MAMTTSQGQVPDQNRTDWPAVAAACVVLFACAVLLVVILGAAFASWTHLQLAFSTIEVEPADGQRRSLVPAFTATAIEVGLFAFSLAGVVLTFLRGERQWSQRLDVWSITAFAAVSFAANVYAGVFALTGGRPADWRTIADVRLVAVFVFAGALPGLIVLSLHVALELVNGWRTWIVDRRAERTRERDRALARARRPDEGSPARTLTLVRPDDGESIVAAAPVAERVAAFVGANGPAHWRTIADQIGIGKTAVYGAARSAGLAIENGTIGPAV